MNLIYSFLTALVLALHISGDVPYTSIENAFKKNSAKELVAMGKSKILVNILGKEGAYSQQQSTLVLEDFFQKHPGSTFEFIFKGKESADGAFAIGNYTSKGEKYRITIHFNKVNNDFKIESLTIERD